MKYAIFGAKSLSLFIFQLLMTLVGMVMLPFFLKRVEPFECEHGFKTYRFKDKWFDAIFGNSEDGVDGDIYYFEKIGGIEKCTLLTRYKWAALRNPIHNLALKMGVNEVIVSYTWKGNRYTADKVGREGWCYSEAIGESGKVYKMFRWCKLWLGRYGVELNVGYKNFNIKEVGQHYKYSFTVSFNPIKKFEE